MDPSNTFVPAFDGRLETGRRLDVEGAHVRGQNGDSVGICLIGGDKGLFTPRQIQTLTAKVRTLQVAYWLSDDKVYGHRDFDPDKTCPGFDVAEWMWGIR